jgi:hypothetical protein
MIACVRHNGGEDDGFRQIHLVRDGARQLWVRLERRLLVVAAQDTARIVEVEQRLDGEKEWTASVKMQSCYSFGDHRNGRLPLLPCRVEG